MPELSFGLDEILTTLTSVLSALFEQTASLVLELESAGSCSENSVVRPVDLSGEFGQR
jgi:hypothetical protein